MLIDMFTTFVPVTVLLLLLVSMMLYTCHVVTFVAYCTKHYLQSNRVLNMNTTPFVLVVVFVAIFWCHDCHYLRSTSHKVASKYYV